MRNQAKNTLSKTEAKIQQEIAMYYRNIYCLKHSKPRCMIFSIPNEGAKGAVGLLIATGMYPGCADLFVLHRAAHCSQCLEANIIQHKLFFVEVKHPDNKSGPLKNGQSENQIEFEKHCKDMGVGYYIVRSLDDFKEVIKNL